MTDFFKSVFQNYTLGKLSTTPTKPSLNNTKIDFIETHGGFLVLYPHGMTTEERKRLVDLAHKYSSSWSIVYDFKETDLEEWETDLWSPPNVLKTL